jgi:hypothetical protein
MLVFKGLSNLAFLPQLLRTFVRAIVAGKLFGIDWTMILVELLRLQVIVVPAE